VGHAGFLRGRRLRAPASFDASVLGDAFRVSRIDARIDAHVALYFTSRIVVEILDWSAPR
jgi:hypothetical protein